MPAYFNTAAFGLIDDGVKAAADSFYTDLASGGSTVAEHWRDTLQPRIRQLLAAFLNAPPEQVAMIPNFSWGLNALVHSLSGTERILLYRGDYPSVTEPFVMNRFPITWLEVSDEFALPTDEILRSIANGETDLVALSHVQYNSGYVLDLVRIGAACRERGIWFVVDATQSLGALPMDLETLPVDVLISSHYKWMNAGFGTGSIYCSEAFLNAFPPKTGGANSYTKAGVPWAAELPMRAWEPGHPNMYGLTLMDAAIAQKMEAGLASIKAHNHELSEIFLTGISGAGLPLIGPESMQDRCSIFVFRDENGLSARLRELQITATLRAGRVRLSFHSYNTVAEIQALTEILRQG